MVCIFLVFVFMWCRNIKYLTVQNVKKLDLIAKLRTVNPEGLNPSLEFYSREDWYEFATWYNRRQGARRKDEMRGGGLEQAGTNQLLFITATWFIGKLLL